MSPLAARPPMTGHPDSASRPPPRCGPYELLVRIGKGGMASVYLARRADRDASDDALFALKILHPNLGQESEFVDMLMDEAKIASQLHHPNVVSTVDLGHDGDRYFMVMDYIEGVAMDRLLRRAEERRPELIVPLAIDALVGLEAAHRLTDPLGRPLELVHRDVTPGNVMVGVDGRGRIADFGVAKARARITKTNPGVVKGKAGYIAPEVILGRPIDGRADVFSMGVLLWNALTGETLFDTEDLASSLTALLKEDPPPPSTVGRMPPPIFDAPILGALHRDPEYRHESAEEMAEALRDALTIYGAGASREAIGGWVLDVFGEQLEKRREYAQRTVQSPAWEPDQAEVISTSAMVRKDPTGRVVSALPGLMHVEEPAETEAPPARSGARVALYVALGILALIGAGFAGAFIATGGSVLGGSVLGGSAPDEEVEVAPPAQPPTSEETPDEVPEITPELFGAPREGEAPPPRPEAPPARPNRRTQPGGRSRRAATPAGDETPEGDETATPEARAAEGARTSPPPTAVDDEPPSAPTAPPSSASDEGDATPAAEPMEEPAADPPAPAPAAPAPATPSPAPSTPAGLIPFEG